MLTMTSRSTLTKISLSLITLMAIPSQAKDYKLPDVAKPGQDGYISGELIYSLENKPTPQCHASTIVETQAGLVAAWFGGKHEKNPASGSRGTTENLG